MNDVNTLATSSALGLPPHGRAGCCPRAGVPVPRRRLSEAASGQRRAERVRDSDYNVLLPHPFHLGRENDLVPRPHRGGCPVPRPPTHRKPVTGVAQPVRVGTFSFCEKNAACLA